MKPPLNTTLTGRISASQEISQPSSPIPSLNLPSWLQGYLEFGWANGHFANILENNNTVQHQVEKESTAAVVRSPGQQEGHEAPAGPPEEQHDGHTAELGRVPPAKGDLEAPAAELDPPHPPPPSGAETPAPTPPPHTPSGEQPIAATPAASPSPPTPPPAAPPSPCSPSQQEREKAGTQPGNCVRTWRAAPAGTGRAAATPQHDGVVEPKEDRAALQQQSASVADNAENPMKLKFNFNSWSTAPRINLPSCPPPRPCQRPCPRDPGPGLPPPPPPTPSTHPATSSSTASRVVNSPEMKRKIKSGGENGGRTPPPQPDPSTTTPPPPGGPTGPRCPSPKGTNSSSSTKCSKSADAQCRNGTRHCQQTRETS